MQDSDALLPFDALVQDWFGSQWPGATEAQARAWPAIASGRHVLVTAPTGSGKTLTAFLWALNGFISGQLAPGATRVLYVSPLKALNNDIQRNLLGPLAELATLAGQRGQQLPDIRVKVRSGDTAASERQRLLRRPPEILVTTPESLNLMLSTGRGRAALATVRTLVLDEIHALAADRRGTHLATAVERLEWLAAADAGTSGDALQRIALSATVRPLARMAAFVGGLRRDATARPVQVIDASGSKELSLSVHTPAALHTAADRGETIWPALAETMAGRINGNRATLVFANSRALTERLTALLNRNGRIAWSHHGSLSRELREAVETRLKEGELPAIVATSSLEMGIDIGALDEVLLVQAPASAAAALQRIGRAGHQVGATSRAVLYPGHAADTLAAAVLAEAVAARDIEPVQPPEQPLDVLAQVLVGMTASETWTLDALYQQVCCAWPYRHLPRQLFDLVLDMLAGRWQDTRLPSLTPRLAVDRAAGTASARRSAVLALYGAGGTIPDRGYYQLRQAGSGARIGELDEEFVWEARPGQVFTLGAQSWQVQRITNNDVLVTPATAGGQGPPPPFWRSEDQLRPWHLAQRQAEWLADADQALADGNSDSLAQRLAAHGFDRTSSTWLLGWLAGQRAATGTGLPHRRRLVLEQCRSAPGGHTGADNPGQVVLHCPWGGRVTQPLALALQALWPDHLPGRPQVQANDDAVALVLPVAVQDGAVAALLATLAAQVAAEPPSLTSLLRRQLEGSGWFGARFRECAGRALLLPRGRIGQRLPLWLSRQRAKDLAAAVRDIPDFPMVLETWRTCLDDCFDLPTLAQLLTELHRGEISLASCQTAQPSPFAATLAWEQISRQMYADDSRSDTVPGSQVDRDLLQAALASGALERAVPDAVLADFVTRRQRLAPGYAPAPGVEAQEWLRERLLLDAGAFDDLLAAIHRDHNCADQAAEDLLPGLCLLQSNRGLWYCTTQDQPAIAALAETGLWQGCVPAAGSSATDRRLVVDLVQQWLAAQPPTPMPALAAAWPGTADALAAALQQLAEAGLAVCSNWGTTTVAWCAADTADSLLRLTRRASQPELPPQPAASLPAFLCTWQDWPQQATADQASSSLAMDNALEVLRLVPTSAAALEQDWLPARLPGYQPAALDAALAGSGWLWLGLGLEQVCLAAPDDLALLPLPQGTNPLPLPDAGARWPSDALASRFGPGWRTALAEAAWAGHLSADSFAPLRLGQLADQPAGPGPGAPPPARPSRRPRATRRAGRAAMAGCWYRPPWPEQGGKLPADAAAAADASADPDALDDLELASERARILLGRHGILCRELVNRELPVLRWQPLFNALRLMELAGEVQSGLFFAGLSGPQFALPAAWQLLARGLPDTLQWLAATDPASPCGLGLSWPGPLALPRRSPGNYLVLRGPTLLATVANQGQRLHFAEGADASCLAPLQHLLERAVAPVRRIEVATINGEVARSSPWVDTLRQTFDVHADHRHLILQRQWRS